MRKQQVIKKIYVFESTQDLTTALAEGKVPADAAFKIRPPPPEEVPAEEVEMPAYSNRPVTTPDQPLTPPPFRPMAVTMQHYATLPPIEPPQKDLTLTLPVKKGWWSRNFGTKEEERFKRLKLQGMACYICRRPNSEWGDQLEGKTLCNECKTKLSTVMAVR